MKYRVIDTFRVKISKDERELLPGQIISLPPEMAEKLLTAEKITHFDQEEAERQAWCIHACMLSSPSQWKLCERCKPKPCVKSEVRN